MVQPSACERTAFTAPTGSHRGCACALCGSTATIGLDPASPWGSVDDSGIGRKCGAESLDEHFETKSIMLGTEGKTFDWYQDSASQTRLN